MFCLNHNLENLKRDLCEVVYYIIGAVLQYTKVHIITLLILFHTIGCGEDPAIKRGKQLAVSGDTAAAIHEFEEALKRDPANAEAYYQLGVVHEQTAQAGQAVIAFQKALRLAPKRDDIRFALGRVYWFGDKPDLALEQFQKLLITKHDILLKIAALTGDAYHVKRLRTEGSNDYEQTFTEKGNIMTFTAKYADDYSPAISPDGKWIAFTSYRLQNGEIYLMNISVPDGEPRQLTHTDEFDEYMPTFSADGKTLAFVTERTKGMMMLPPIQASGSVPSTAKIYLMDIDGRNQRPLAEMPGMQSAPAFSPNGQKIAFESNFSETPETDNDMEIFVINIDGTGQIQLTDNDVDDGNPTWTPDGKQIAFVSNIRETYQICVMNAKGGDIKQRTASTDSHYQPLFTPDGKRIIYVSDAHNHYTLWMMNADGTNKTQLTNHIGAHFEPSLSHDGKKLVFSADRSDHMRIYLLDFTQPIKKEELQARFRLQ